MTAWTAARVREATDGIWTGSPPLEFAGVSTDTRTLAPGELFVALAGPRHDAHDHLDRARDAGAGAAVVRRGTVPPSGLPVLEVEDTLVALGALGRVRRRAVPGPVVAITGSNGKTSTKEMVAAVLRTRYRTHATRANLNNLVGIPLTLLDAPEDTEALVIEAGASETGELERARHIIEPRITVITNVAEAHLEGFGSVEGVMREKLSLAHGVPLAIVGTAPPSLAESARALAGRVVTAGFADADVTPEETGVDEAGQGWFRIDGVRVTLPIPGPHLVANAMLAWVLVRELGLDRQPAAAALSGLTLPGGRGELLTSGGLTILHDAYNANPLSFRAAIATARALRQGRRLVFVAGTMRELGEASSELHAAIAGELVDLAPDVLAGVGEFASALEPFRGRLGEGLLTAPDVESLGPELARRLTGHEVIILKASRGVALERILPWLTDRPAPSH